MTTLQFEMRDVRDIVSTAGQNGPIHDIDLIELGLPYDTSEKLKNFEKELSNSDFRQSMVYYNYYYFPITVDTIHPY